ncbi:MAG: RloB family protein [Burkholderiales bacterium]
MARTSSSFNRVSRFKPDPIVLVICEDSKSGKNYLEEAAAYFRVRPNIKISHCGKTNPIGIVEEAKLNCKKFDRIYCMIDRDNHYGFDEAINLIRDYPKITIIASYPCFEFWLLLHFQYSRKPFIRNGNKSSGELMIDFLRTVPSMEEYDKGDARISFKNMIKNKLSDARANSGRAFREAIAVGENNPSTQMHLLIDEFEKLSNPQSI